MASPNDFQHHPSVQEVLARLWISVGLPSSVLAEANVQSPLDEKVTSSANPQADLGGPNTQYGQAHVLRSSFRIGVAAQASIAAFALAASFLSALQEAIAQQQSRRDANANTSPTLHSAIETIESVETILGDITGWQPSIVVPARHAALEYASENLTRVLPRSLGAHEDVRSALDKSFPPTDPAVRSVVGISPETAGSWDVLAGTYPTARRQDGTKRQDYVRLHTNFPHHKAGLLRILGLIPSQHSAQSTPSEAEAMKAVTREQVAHALTLWDAQDFEKVARERGMCATMMRTEQEWESSEMGKAVRQWLEEDGGGPVKVRRIEAGGKAGGPEQDPDRTSFMEDRKIAEKATISLLDNCVFSTSTEPAPPLPLSVNFGAKDTENASQTRVGKADSSSKDSGRALRIIDMSRVIAAPVAGRVLAVYGAQVLLISSSHLPHLPLFELDTARGKRAAWLELDEPFPTSLSSGEGSAEIGAREAYPGRRKLQELIKEADVFLQAYRPSGLSSRGFSPQDVANVRPGIVYASLSAYGPYGPWAGVRGFDSLVQTATGMNHSESSSYHSHTQGPGESDTRHTPPRPMPVQALDHASGYLLAFGILAAKCRSALDLLASSCDPGSGSGLERASSSWQVEVCLAGTSAWLRSLGRVHGALAWDVPNEIQPNGQEVYDLLQPVKYRRGAAGGARSDENGDGSGVTLFGLRHAAQVNGHSPGWDQVPGDLGVDRAEWW